MEYSGFADLRICVGGIYTIEVIRILSVHDQIDKKAKKFELTIIGSKEGGWDVPPPHLCDIYPINLDQ